MGFCFPARRREGNDIGIINRDGKETTTGIDGNHGSLRWLTRFISYFSLTALSISLAGTAAGEDRDMESAHSHTHTHTHTHTRARTRRCWDPRNIEGGQVSERASMDWFAWP
jgi:hypothetical protein